VIFWQMDYFKTSSQELNICFHVHKTEPTFHIQELYNLLKTTLIVISCQTSVFLHWRNRFSTEKWVSFWKKTGELFITIPSSKSGHTNERFHVFILGLFSHAFNW
jgi:hypothetical protein